MEIKPKLNTPAPKPPAKVGERNKKRKGKKSKSRRGDSEKRSESPPPDILDPAAMENLHLIAHSAPEALAYRGFNWTSRKKKGG